MPKKTANEKKILIVDDEKTTLRALSDRLKIEGYKIFTALDGKAGLNTALKEHPDMILLDIIMPKMDGVTVLKRLRENDWGKQVPIMLLTVLDLNDERLKEIVDLKVAYYFTKKDWTLDDVAEKVKKMVGA